MPSDPTPAGPGCPDPALRERHRLAELLLDDADRFVPGAFADGVRHAAARLLDPRFVEGSAGERAAARAPVS